MKRNKHFLFILLCLCVLMPHKTMAQTPEQLMHLGNEAYSAGNFDEATEAYENILTLGYSSAELYYNLGNSYYRQEELGLAILNYERALRLKPGDSDIRENLNLANSKTQDQIASLPQFIVTRWYQNMVQWFSPHGWRNIVLILLAMLGGSVATFFLSHQYRLRKVTVVTSIIVALLLSLTIGCSCSSAKDFREHQSAIVIKPLIIVKAAPEAKSVDKLVLHEGTKVETSEEMNGWIRIHLSDGNNGWVEQSDIERI